MSYKRTYEDITLKYSLPSKCFHPSKILEDYVNRIASQRDISPEEVIDAYVNIYIQDLGKNVTKMIYHDGNNIFNSVDNNCIIDDAFNSMEDQEEHQ